MHHAKKHFNLYRFLTVFSILLLLHRPVLSGTNVHINPTDQSGRQFRRFRSGQCLIFFPDNPDSASVESVSE